jgi:dipeptidyl aminopeptidase/acylaminoacyl peptidase
MVRHWRRGCIVAALSFALFATLSGPAAGQDNILSKEAYLTPPKAIADAILAPRHENVALTNLSPDGKKFVITRSDGMPTLERLACPCVYLGEMAFDPSANRSRDLWIRSMVGFDIYYYGDNRKVSVKVPDKARVSNPLWSPDGSRLAFFAHFADATHIYVADAATGLSSKLTDIPVLATLDTSFQWSKDGKQIQTVLLPDEGKRVMPKHETVAMEPKVRVSRGANNPSRTYRFLLESPHDMKLLEHLATGQLTLISVEDHKITRIGEPSMIRSVSMAPGEQQFRVVTMKKPFSYFVPAARFGSLESVWSRDGKNLYTLVDKELKDAEPSTPVAPKVTGGKGGKGAKQATQPPPVDPTNPDDPKGFGPPVDPDAKRSITWRPDGAGLSYLQLEPAKTKDAKEARKDRVLQWLPPYGKDDVKVVYETPDRITGLQYSDDCQMLFLTQTVDNQRQISAVDLSDPKQTVYVITKGAAGGKDIGPAPDKKDQTDGDDDGFDDEQQKKGGGKGFAAGAGFAASLLTHTYKGELGVVRISSAGEVYLSGTDRTGGAVVPRPYIDKINIKTGKKTRIFEGPGGDLLETVDAVDGDDIKIVFTTRQKDKVVPDSYLTDLQGGTSKKLTSNIDYTPWFHDLKVERIQVTRVDGIKFWVKVTTSPNATGKQPALFWIYPREYTDQAAYDRTAGGAGGVGGGKGGPGAANRFTAPGPRSMALLTLEGYAVVEPDVPIIGPAGRMNDNYVPDLRNSLWAVIDELDRRGIIDRDRLACGGHSYGAFSTANALAHTPFFKAGIAGDGNYNRTLTSMTFQTEKRLLWDARETYLEMSPLLWANRVNGALLMYHGMDDANVGTNPINAEHLFLALDGLGKPAALYMYPYEGHGPVGRETNLDQWARWIAWLDLYVKNPQKKK